MRKSGKYVLAALLLCALSLYFSYPQVDFTLLGCFVVIGIFVRELYNMDVRKRWYAGAATFVDELRGENMDAFFLKTPLRFLYYVALGVAVFGHLFMSRH